ncbi:multiple inositol polyphosphate phosphatase 1-like [Lineus longissimus]|uniref:multiple inositol polyphosphate phosphatase 1-like n=1 Tax=Lineus longissimus TaxID=88925 RepID=UPI00315DD3A2
MERQFPISAIKMLNVWFALLFLGSVVSLSQQQDMPSNGLSTDGLLRLGSRTNYRAVSAFNFPGGFPTTRPSTPWSKICRPIQFYLFSRHGHRGLGDSALENARDFAADFRKRFPGASGAKWFVNYTLPWDITDDILLTKVGKEDMELFGKRVVRLWSDLSLSANNTLFYTSSKSRTYESAKAFIDGFTSVLGKDRKDFQLNIDNLKTRFYKYCEKYKVSVDDNDTAMIEAERFMEGPEMEMVVTNVKRRLGIEAYNNTLIDKDRKALKDLYYMCQAELAENITKPIWCYIFNDTDSIPMEYYLDTEDYYAVSYGYDINTEMSCPLVKHIFDKLDAAKSGVENMKDYQRGVFGFGHTGSLVPLLSAFGMFKPEKPLTASNFPQQINRKFRMSRANPFNGNLEFVLYECNRSAEEGLSPSEKAGLPVIERFMVEVYSNEKLTKLPFCDKELCPYSKVRDVMKSYLTCSLNKVCEVKTASGSDVPRITLLPLAMAIAMVLRTFGKEI